MRMLLLVAAGLVTAATAPPRTVTLTASQRMKFDHHAISARAGEPLRVIVKAVGDMPKQVVAHNFVLVRPGTDLDRFNAEAFNARETDFIPPEMKDAVIAHSGLAGAGETVDVTFDAPNKPGQYIFFCSFPGHFAAGMRGVLNVK